MINKDWNKLIKKAHHPSKLTDKELAQVRRSSRSSVGSHLLYKIVKEQKKRGLLRDDFEGCGYLPEKKRLISDYEDK